MTAATLHRTAPAAFRSTGDGRTLSGWAVRYGVVDSYGTAFAPGVFDASLARGLPLLVWAHDPARPLGRVTSARGDASGLAIVGRLDDPDAVPDVRQALAQVASRTVTGLSVGFVPEDAERRRIAGEDVVVFTRATLHEVSLVIVPAVPGSDITDLRRPSHGSYDPQLEVEAREALDVAARRGAPSLVDDAQHAAALATLARRGLR